jgi:hypothetical protein
MSAQETRKATSSHAGFVDYQDKDGKTVFAVGHAGELVLSGPVEDKADAVAEYLVVTFGDKQRKIPLHYFDAAQRKAEEAEAAKLVKAAAEQKAADDKAAKVKAKEAKEAAV